MKYYHIKDVFGNYMTFENNTKYSFFGLLWQMLKCLITGISIALLICAFFYFSVMALTYSIQ